MVTTAAGTTAAPTVTVYLAEAAGSTELSAVIVNANEPALVGVPLITPVEVFRLSPSGSAPAVTWNVGAGKPDAVTANEYAVPTVAAGGAAEVIAGGAAMTTV